MILNFESLRHMDLNCFEEAIATVAGYYDKGFELMFLENLTFKISHSDKSTVGDLIDIVRPAGDLRLESLCNFHGLLFTKFPDMDNRENIIKSIESEISNNRLVLIWVKAYYTPWDENFMKEQNYHACCVNGIDSLNQIIYFTDPYYSVINYQVPYDLFFQLYAKHYTTKILDYEQHNQKNLLSFLLNDLKDFKNSNVGNVSIEIRKLRNLLMVNLDLEYEAAGYNNFSKTPLFNKLGIISKSRYNYAKALKIIAENNNISSLLEISESISSNGDEWFIIRALITKSFLRKTYSDSIKENIGLKLKKLEYSEEDIINRLIEVLSSINLDRLPLTHALSSTNMSTSTSNIDPYIIKETMNKLTGSQNFEFPNLIKHYNNRAFASGHHQADLNGNNYYFMNNKFQYGGLFQTDCAVYNIPNTLQTLYDNISCEKQIIDISRCTYTYIHLIGCSESGNFNDEIVCIYDGNLEQKVKIQIPDWYHRDHIKSYDSDKIITGKMIENNVKTDKSVFLYERSYKLLDKPLINIILPMCPNIHLFSISLRKLNI